MGVRVKENHFHLSYMCSITKKYHKQVCDMQGGNYEKSIDCRGSCRWGIGSGTS